MSTEQRIIEEGKKLIEVYGFRKFKMDELAQNLRISKKTIYLHFKNKDELISSICDSIIAADLEEMKTIIDQKEDYVEKLRAVFFLYNIRMLRKKYLNELKRFFPEDWEKFRAFSENRRDYVRQIYREGVEKGVFIAKCPTMPSTPSPIDEKQTVELLIFILTSVINQAFETEMTDYEFDVNTMLIYSFEMLIKMFIVE
ncbi:TetR/AcrR family transcriptional regulator [Bacillus massiliigorillae]|uniref:TetR/AcrR family transcriptional regulator n=1 Tax=Bacillus massiliigorillae TaxID=1243664 RepID=UPI00039CEEE8|nr:TetR/AcrR family transcriptional regulator [Bacillus massiliigorillae]